MLLACLPSHSRHRVTDCTPSSITCFHSDSVGTVFFKSPYGVASRAIRDGSTALILIITLSCRGVSLPHHHIAVHHWATGDTPGEEDTGGCCWAHTHTWLARSCNRIIVERSVNSHNYRLTHTVHVIMLKVIFGVFLVKYLEMMPLTLTL